MGVTEGPMTFAGRVAVVTGGGRGLGRAYALSLAERGARVVVNDLGCDVFGEGADSQPARRVAETITSAGGHAIADFNDISEPGGAVALVQTAMDNYGRVDVVINNAGVAGAGKTIDDLGLGTFERTWQVHVKGTFCVTKAAWGVMAEQGYGRIVLTTSGAALFGSPRIADYCAAKGAIVGLTRCLAREGRPLGINVNAVAPLAWTRIPQRSENHPLAPYADALGSDRVAEVVAFLAHETSSVTGEVFDVGGGNVARIVIGTTAGLSAPDITAEMVRDRFSEVFDGQDLRIPLTAEESIRPPAGVG